MKKKIKKWGDCKVITFSPEECEIYKLNVDDVIDITITEVKKLK